MDEPENSGSFFINENSSIDLTSGFNAKNSNSFVLSIEILINPTRRISQCDINDNNFS